MQNSEIKTQNYSVKPKNELKARSFEFSLQIIKLVSSFPEKRVYWVIGDQLLRSSTSIGANGVLLEKNTCDNLLAEADQLIRMLVSSLLTLKGKSSKILSSHSEL